MRFLPDIPVRAALAIALAAAPFSLPAKQKEVSCRALADRLLAGRMTAETKIAEEPQRCVVTDVRFQLSKYQGWAVDRLTVSGPDFRRLEKGRPLPTALDVEAHGITLSPDIDDSHTRYMMRAQQRPFDARLSYVWDEAAGRMHLKELAVDSPAAGLIAFSADADLPDIARLTQSRKPGQIGIRHLKVVFDNNGLFEGMLLPVFLGMIPADQDPAVEVPKAQARDMAAIAKLPDTAIDRASKDALSRFLRDFPNPRGYFELEQTFDTPLELGGLSSLPATAASAWLHGSHISARYDMASSRYRSSAVPATAR